MQTLKEQLNRREGALQASDNKHSDEEKRRLQEEIKRLQASLKQLKEVNLVLPSLFIVLYPQFLHSICFSISLRAFTLSLIRPLILFPNAVSIFKKMDIQVIYLESRRTT